MQVSSNAVPKYTILADGHIVGSDQFVCPLTFAEFNTRFPNHVRNFTRRNASYRNADDIDDITFDLVFYLDDYGVIPLFRPGAVVTSLTWFSYVNQVLLHRLVRTYQHRPGRRALWRIIAKTKFTVDL